MDLGSLTRRTLLAATATAMLVSPAAAQDTAWAGGPEAAAQIDALYKAALVAGQSEVVIYGAYSVVFQPVWDIFKARFPEITVVGNPLRGTELMARVEAEKVSGQHVGDMVMSGMTELITTAEGGAGAAYQPPNIAAVPERYHDRNGRFVISFADTVGIAYNKDQLKDSDLPQTLADLTDPKYKGMLFDDPLAGAITTLSWVELLDAGKIDAAWMSAVRGNAVIVPSATPYFNNLSVGSIALMPWAAHSRILRLQQGGANVGFLEIPGLVIPLYAGTVLLEGGPNDKASQLLQAWLITPEAQAAIVEAGLNYPVVPGIAVPDNWTPLDAIVADLDPVSPSEYLAAKAKLEAAVREAFN